MQALSINLSRFIRDFEALAEIGSTGDGGVHRPALSKAHLAARRWFQDRAALDGLEFRVDAAGNHSAVLPCAKKPARTLLIGSHLDSVPNGGRFDGALGVVTALEVLRTIKDAGLELSVHLEAIDFTDEEGTLVELLGSRALAGSLSADDLESPRGGKAALEQGFTRAGITSPLQAKRPQNTLAGFLEVHIEQGDRLVEQDADIGIVTSLVGIGSYEFTFSGRADHAGTTPMDVRRDAGLGAAAVMLAAREKVIKDFPECVINFGAVRFSPGAFNIVPGKAVAALEYRAPNDALLDELEAALLELAYRTAHVYQLDLTYEKRGCVGASPCAPEVQDAFAFASEMLGLKAIRLTSGAGHDTQAMAGACPSGMIFIPSTGGSHNPNEFATWKACENGANVVLNTTLHFIMGAY